MANEEHSYILSTKVHLNDGCDYKYEIPDELKVYVLYSRKLFKSKEISLKVFDTIISIHVLEDPDHCNGFVIGNLVGDIVYITKRECQEPSQNLVKLREKITELVQDIIAANELN